MHVALAAVHYHADVIKGVSILIVPDIDVVSGGFDVSVAAKGARENIRNAFLSAGLGLADYLAQALGDIVSRSADRLALPVHRARNRFKVFGEPDEVCGLDDNRIALYATNTVYIIGIKHFPLHSLHHQDNWVFELVCHVITAPRVPGTVNWLAVLVVGPAAEADKAVGVETYRLATMPLTGTVDFQIRLCDAAVGVCLAAEAVVLAAGNRVARSLALAARFGTLDGDIALQGIEIIWLDVRILQFKSQP